MLAIQFGIVVAEMDRVSQDSTLCEEPVAKMGFRITDARTGKYMIVLPVAFGAVGLNGCVVFHGKLTEAVEGVVTAGRNEAGCNNTENVLDGLLIYVCRIARKASVSARACSADLSRQ